MNSLFPRSDDVPPTAPAAGEVVAVISVPRPNPSSLARLGGLMVGMIGVAIAAPAAIAGDSLLFSELSSEHVASPSQNLWGSVAVEAGVTKANRRRVRFVPPKDARPTTTVGTGSRGRVRFAPPAERAPTTTVGTGSRGRVRFAPPGERAPTTTVGTGSRGRVRFSPPGERAPSTTVGTASREELTRDDARVLLPPDSYTQTYSDRPTLMLYLPATGADRAFVSIKDLEGTFHYQTEISLTEDNGIVTVPFPNHAPALEVGRDYLWQVVFLAPGEQLAPDTPALQTVMSRVTADASLTFTDTDVLTPAIALEKAVDLAEAGLWTDTLQVLADARRLNPDHAALQEEWSELLTQVGLGELAAVPLLSTNALTEPYR